MFLAVMDFKNKAVPNPNAMDINNSRMRCLVKNIAMFGLGLYIYAGEDLPEAPGFYNEIAWLVANTEGDFDEAVALSQKSIELAQASGDSPHRLGGLLDTLAHCYYAKKDYASAVEYQQEAAQLDSHTQSIKRALVRFREALAKQQAGGK